MFFNIMNKAYKSLWVPICGRILFKFVSFIEGKPPAEKPTYNISDVINIETEDQSNIK